MFFKLRLLSLKSFDVVITVYKAFILLGCMSCPMLTFVNPWPSTELTAEATGTADITCSHKLPFLLYCELYQVAARHILGLHTYKTSWFRVFGDRLRRVILWAYWLQRDCLAEWKAGNKSRGAGVHLECIEQGGLPQATAQLASG